MRDKLSIFKEFAAEGVRRKLEKRGVDGNATPV
jgi:hypothetical protein